MFYPEIINEIDGMISLNEAILLYDLASEVKPPNVVVEIGSYRGKSTAALSMGTIDNGVEVYAVDPHRKFRGDLGINYGPEDRKEFLLNMVKCNGYRNVNLINLHSGDLLMPFRHEVGLLFVDGDHSYDSVIADIRWWEHSIIQGGAIAFDDYKEAGVSKAICKLIEEGFKKDCKFGKIQVLRS